LEIDPETGVPYFSAGKKLHLDNEGRVIEDVLKQFLLPGRVKLPTHSGLGAYVTSVGCGSNFVLAVVRDKATNFGIVHVSGMNNYGQLGTGHVATLKAVVGPFEEKEDDERNLQELPAKIAALEESLRVRGEDREKRKELEEKKLELTRIRKDLPDLTKQVAAIKQRILNRDPAVEVSCNELRPVRHLGRSQRRRRTLHHRFLTRTVESFPALVLFLLFVLAPEDPSLGACQHAPGCGWRVPLPGPDAGPAGSVLVG
jgi:hypothetical protein